MRIRKEAIMVLAIAGSLAACSSSDDSPDTGTLSISLMDAPVDGVEELWVTISEVWLKPAGDGPAQRLEMAGGDTPITVNLLELGYDNASVLVDSVEVEARAYNWIELQIDDTGINEAYVMTEDGGMYDVDVDVPSGRIRLVSGFEVGPNQGMRIYFDWNVRAGLTDPVGQDVYLLRPAFRVLYADEIGVLAGSITLENLQAALCAEPANPVVYIYEGNVTPSDMEDPPQADEPYLTVDAELNMETNTHDFSTVVTPGDYTVAFICDGAADTVASEELEFFGTQMVTVLPDLVTEEVVFDVPPSP